MTAKEMKEYLANLTIHVPPLIPWSLAFRIEMHEERKRLKEGEERKRLKEGAA